MGRPLPAASVAQNPLHAKVAPTGGLFYLHPSESFPYVLLVYFWVKIKLLCHSLTDNTQEFFIIASGIPKHFL